MLKKLVPCSNSTILESIRIHTPSNSSCHSETLRRVESQSSVGSKVQPNSQGNSIALAFLNSKQQIELCPQALEAINAHPKQQVIFCGLLRLGSQKSKLSSKLFELPALTVINSKNRNPQLSRKYLRITRVPLSVQNSKKIFFIEYSRDGKNDNYYRQEQQKLIDLLMVVCDNLIIETNGVSFDLSEQALVIGRSQQRMDLKVQSSVWPQTAYVLKPNGSSLFNFNYISSCFRKIVPISLLNTNYQFDYLLGELAASSPKKRYGKMEISPSIVCKFLIELTKQQNTKKNSGVISIGSVLDNVILQLYQETYSYLTDMYDALAIQYFSSEQPYSMDYVLDAFALVKSAVLDKYQLRLSDQLTQKFLQKLQDYIDQKQRLVLEVNKKKNRFALRQSLQAVKVSRHQISSQESLHNVVRSIAVLSQKHQHGAAEIIPDFLLNIVSAFQKNQQTGVKKDAKKYKQIQQSICDRQYEYQILQEKNQGLAGEAKLKQKEYDNFKQKRKQLKATILALRKQLELSVRNNQEVLTSKKQVEQRAEQMLELIRELQQKKRENEYVLRGIQSELSFDPEFDKIERRLSTLNRECQRCEETKEIILSRLTENLQEDNINNYTFHGK